MKYEPIYYNYKMPHLYNDFLIGTTRFNEKTAIENKKWREKRKWKGCIYGVPKMICKTIPNEIQIIVIEMLNQKSGGKILGFGLIKNYLRVDTIAHIYEDRTYNRYIYNSNYRLDSNEIPEAHKETIKFLESMLFYGYSHMKRGQGITTLNWQKMKSEKRKEIKKFFRELFVKL